MPIKWRTAVTKRTRGLPCWSRGWPLRVRLSGCRDDRRVERKATLTGSGTAATAKSEAEVEVSRSNNRLDQDVEMSVSNLTPGVTYTVLIDATQVGTFTTDKNVRAAITAGTSERRVNWRMTKPPAFRVGICRHPLRQRRP